MGIEFPEELLKLVKSGTLNISENHKESLRFVFDKNTITIDLIDIEFNVPTSKGLLVRLSEARKFAKNLKKKKLTLCIAHKGKIVMKLGEKANPKLSRLLTQSGAVEITNLRELRKLDKRLRIK